jgi:hypothetical protein
MRSLRVRVDVELKGLQAEERDAKEMYPVQR